MHHVSDEYKKTENIQKVCFAGRIAGHPNAEPPVMKR